MDCLAWKGICLSEWDEPCRLQLWSLKVQLVHAERFQRMRANLSMVVVEQHAAEQNEWGSLQLNCMQTSKCRSRCRHNVIVIDLELAGSEVMGQTQESPS